MATVVESPPAAGRSISQVAEETGLTAHALRYYERAGLMLRPVDRAASSHRRYDEADVRWVTLLTKLRGTGMPIRQIKRYAALVRTGQGTEAERLALLEEHRAAVLRQLEEVQENLAAIDHKIAVYRDCVCAEQAAIPSESRPDHQEPR